MNRHDRRRAFAEGVRAGKTGDMSGPLGRDYVQMIEAIALSYRASIAKGYADGIEPRFAFPPRDVMLIAPIETKLETIARNEAARVFLNGIVKGAKLAKREPPTVFMVRIALERGDAPIEYLSLADFGIAVGGRNN